jgi:hypothetical protein
MVESTCSGISKISNNFLFQAISSDLGQQVPQHDVQDQLSQKIKGPRMIIIVYGSILSPPSLDPRIK